MKMSMQVAFRCFVFPIKSNIKDLDAKGLGLFFFFFSFSLAALNFKDHSLKSDIPFQCKSFCNLFMFRLQALDLYKYHDKFRKLA